MATDNDLERVIEHSHQAVDAFARGDPEPLKALYSHEADVSIANPFGPPAVGWPAAADTMDRAAKNYRDGRATGFDRVAGYATPGLAYVVEIERIESRVGGAGRIVGGHAARDDHPAARGRDLEDRPPARRPHHEREIGSVGHRRSLVIAIRTALATR